MKTVGIEVGRAGYLFPLEEVRPWEGFNLVEAVARIAERYQFQYPPSLPERFSELQSSGLNFGLGMYGDKTVTELNIYSDGVVASSLNTNFSLAFLDDLINWGQKELGLRELIDSSQKYYFSQVIVEFEKPASAFIERFDEIARMIGEALEKNYQVQEPVRFEGVSFGCDKTKLPLSFKGTNFRIERRIGKPYDRERYFSESPLPTDQHLELLERMESLFS